MKPNTPEPKQTLAPEQTRADAQERLERGLPEHLGQVSDAHHATLEHLELNLIHLATNLEVASLKLNKSGTPNRRSLSKFSQGILMPTRDKEPASPELDLQDPEQVDYLAFLLALLIELNVIQTDERELLARAHHEPALKHFTHHEERRNRTLSACVRNLKHWSEIISAQLSMTQLTPSDQQLEAQLSLTQSNGSPLIGARGYLLSVLKRAAPAQWTTLDSFIELCTELDRDYLPRVLGRAGSALSPAQYIVCFIEHMLYWLGVVELARGESQERLFRLTARGQRWLEVPGVEPAPEADASPKPCLVVQPNMEVMLFLDAASIPTTFKLYRFTQRTGLADRVATFRLNAQTVQRGYSLGLDAAKVIDFFDAHGFTPLDQSLRFTLEDWERSWQRVALYADGLLLRHQDPDAFDLIIGQLQHQWRDLSDVEVIRLSHGSAFVSCDDIARVAKDFERYPHLIINYLGHIPPAFDFNDHAEPLRFEVNLLACDFMTVNLLDGLATWEKERAKPDKRSYLLNLDRLKATYPSATLAQSLSALRPRAIDGLPAATELKLRALLSAPAPRAQLAHDIFVIYFNDPHSAELFGAIPQAQELIVERLGDRAFGVMREDEPAIEQILTRLSIPYDTSR